MSTTKKNFMKSVLVCINIKRRKKNTRVSYIGVYRCFWPVFLVNKKGWFWLLQTWSNQKS